MDRPALLLDIQLLGGFGLAGVDVPAAGAISPRLQALLAYLVLNHANPQPRARLAFLLWPDSTEAQALTNLRSLVLRLRETVPHADRFLVAGRTTLHWRSDAGWTSDVARFEAACARGDAALEHGAAVEARMALTEAAGVYHGDLLPACYDDWIEPPRARLHTQFVAALERLGVLHEQARAYPEAIAAAQRLLAADPLREETYRTLMRLHALSDDPAAAAQIYRRCADVLERELGAAPGRATQELYERITRRSPAVEPAPLPPAALVGRHDEWSRLLDAWHAARERPRLALIAGEAGIGKTRLAEELLAWAERQGIAVAAARCYATGAGTAYAPVAAWLRSPAIHASLAALDLASKTELSRLLPELLAMHPAPPVPAPLAEGWQRTRFHDALLHAVVHNRRRLLLLLDDMQWADGETLLWLHALLRADPAPQLLIVGTLRIEARAVDGALEMLRTALQREDQLTTVTLGPLGQEDTSILATLVAGHTLPPDLAATLYGETEGNPLFVVETIRAWDVAGDTGEGRRAAASSPTLQAVIGERLAHLPSPAHALAAVGAVIGRHFDLDLLARASRLDLPALADGLDELCARHVLREHGASYDFTHDKLREATYANLSLVRRRLLHREVALALEARQAPETAAQNAEHFVRAELPDRALPHYVRAAEAAQRVYANAEAAALYGRACAIARDLGRPTAELTPLFLAGGRACELDGRYADAVAVYRELEELARARGDAGAECAAIARLAIAHCVPASSVFNLETAVGLVERGLDLVRDLDAPEVQAQLLWARMLVLSNRIEIDEAMAPAEAAIAFARRHALREQLAFILHDATTLLFRAGDTARADSCAEEARAIFRETGNLPMLGNSLANQAVREGRLLQLDTAVEYADEALAVSREIGALSNIGQALGLRGMVHGVRGNWGRCQADTLEAVHVWRRAGVVVWPGMATELGHLLLLIGQVDAARAWHLEALAGCDSTPLARWVCQIHLALAAFAGGDPPAGAALLREAMPHARPVGVGFVITRVADALVAAAEHDGDWTAAVDYLRWAVPAARSEGLLYQEPDLVLLQARCSLALGDAAAADAAVRAALAIAATHALRPILWQGNALLARICTAAGRTAEAAAARNAARAAVGAIAASLDDPAQRASFLATPAVRALDAP